MEKVFCSNEHVSYNSCDTFAINPIKKILDDIMDGKCPVLRVLISNICRSSNIEELLVDFLNDYVGYDVYKTSDFNVTRKESGVIIEVENSNPEDYCMLISINNGLLYVVQNQFDGDRYIIELTNNDDGPLDCIHPSDNLPEKLIEFIDKISKKGGTPFNIQENVDRLSQIC